MVRSLLTVVKSCKKYFIPPFFWETIQCLPAMAYYVVSSCWISPLCETGTTIAHMADSLGVHVAAGLIAEVRAADRRRAKGTAAEPVELEAKPTDSVSRGNGPHRLKCQKQFIKY